MAVESVSDTAAQQGKHATPVEAHAAKTRSKLVSLVGWFFRMWPVLVPVALIALHYLVAAHTGWDVRQTNRVISLVLLVIGGVIVLYSINANLGFFDDSTLFSLFISYLKSFPLLTRRDATQEVPASVNVVTRRARAWPGATKKTSNERLKYLQLQIEQIKQDLNQGQDLEESAVVQLESQTREAISDVRQTIVCINRKVKKLCVCSIKMQVFGVLLMLHGYASSYFF